MTAGNEGLLTRFGEIGICCATQAHLPFAAHYVRPWLDNGPRLLHACPVCRRSAAALDVCKRPQRDATAESHTKSTSSGSLTPMTVYRPIYLLPKSPMRFSGTDDKLPDKHLTPSACKASHRSLVRSTLLLGSTGCRSAPAHQRCNNGQGTSRPSPLSRMQ